jgi:hypothetical protein
MILSDMETWIERVIGDTVSQPMNSAVTFTVLFIYKTSRVAQSVYSLATGWTTGRSRFGPRQRRKDFSSSLCVKIGSGAHPASCTMGTKGPFPGGKALPRCDVDHSPPPSAEVENE